MKRCAIPALGLVVLLFPAMAIAQVDPAPDGIGLYFDQTATQVAVTVTATPEAPAELTAYLIATRVSVAGYAMHCEGFLEWDRVAIEVVAQTPSGFDICFDDPPAYSDNICADFDSGAILTGPIMVLKRYDLRVLQTEPIRFHIRSLRLWLGGVIEVPLHPSSGSWDVPVAVINGAAPVPVVAGTWGAVKSLYGR